MGTLGTILLIGVITYLAYPREDEVSDTEAAAPAEPTAGAVSAPEGVDPTDYLARVKARAVEWNADAQLVSIEAGPIVAGKVRLNSGKIHFSYAPPAGELVPGARVGTERLFVRLNDEGEIAAEKGTANAGARSVADPGCTVEQAWRAVVASGVPSSAQVSIIYEYSEGHARAVWRTQATHDPKHHRTLDGKRCTILVR